MTTSIDIFPDWDENGKLWYMVRVDGRYIDGFETESDAWMYIHSKEISV